MIRLNWKAIGVFVVVLTALSAGTFALYRYQRNRTTARFLAEARAAQAKADYPAALASYQMYLENRPGDLDAIRALGTVLDELARVGQVDPADVAACYDRLLEFQPDDRDARRHLVDVLVGRRPQDTVAETFQRLRPDDAQDIRRHVQILQRDAAGTPPAEAAALIEAQGLAALRLNDIPAARAAFRDVLQRDPARILAASIYAALLIDPALQDQEQDQQGQPPQPPPDAQAEQAVDAMVAANEAIKDNPNLAAAYVERAALRRALKKDWRADLDRARKLDPKGLPILLQAGQFAGAEGRLDEARGLLRDAIAVDPKDPRAYQQLAGIELRAGRPEEAAAWLRQGLDKLGDQTDPNLSWFLTNVLVDTGQTDEARAELDKYRSLRLEYNSPEAKLARAAQTRFVEAIIALGEAKTPAQNARAAVLLAGIDSSVLAQDKQARLDGIYFMTLARAHERSIDRNGPPAAAQDARNKAIVAYRRAIAIMPTSADPLLRLAELLGSAPVDPKLDDQARAVALAERLEAAVEVLDAGLAQFPATSDDPVVRDNLGRVLAGLVQLRMTEQARRPEGQRSWDAVERLLARGLQVAPGSSALNDVALRFAVAAGKLPTATAQLRELVGKEPAASNPDAWVALAQSWLLQRRPDEALKVLDEATAKVGDKVALRLVRAAAEQERGDAAAALAALTTGIDSIPSDDRPRLWQQVAQLQVGRREFDAARVAIKRWAQLRPRQLEPHTELFRIAIQLKDEAEARAELAEIETLDGKDGFRTRCARVDLALTFQTPEQLAAEVDALLKAYPDRPESHYASGVYLADKVKDTEGAIKAFRAALALTPSIGIVNRLAAAYAKAGKLDDLDALRREFSGSAALTQLSVLALAEAGQKDRAAELAAELAQGNPEALNVQIWQADVLRGLGNPDEAARKLKELIAANKQLLDPWVSLFMLQVGQRQMTEAAATLEEIKRNVKVERPELVWGRLAATLGDRAAADRDFQAALARWPEDPLVLQTVVSYYRQSGRDADAAATLRAVRQRKPDARWATHQLADLLAIRASTWPEAFALVEPPPPADQDTSSDRFVRAMVFARGPGAAEKDKAIALLKPLADDPTNPQTVETRLILAQLYRDQGRTVEAFEQARLASANSTALAAIVFFIDLAVDSGKLPEARQALARLVATEPDSLRTAVVRARVLQKEGKPAEGIPGIQKALSTQSGAETDPTYLLAAPPLLFRLGDEKAGAAALDQVASLRPDVAWAMIPALVDADRIEEAFALAERTVGTEQVANAAGVLLQSMVRRPLDGAVVTRLDELVDAALKVNPKVANLLIGQATLRHYQGRFQDEIAIYESVLKEAPNRGDFLNNMAWTLSESLGKPEEALKYIDKALTMMPDEPSIADTKGVILMRLKQYPQAIQVLTNAAQDAALRAPGVLPVVRYHLARAYHANGQLAPATLKLAEARRSGFRTELLSLEERKDAESFLAQFERPAAAPGN